MTHVINKTNSDWSMFKNKSSIPSMAIACDHESKINPIEMENAPIEMNIRFDDEMSYRAHWFGSEALSSIVDFTSELRSLKTMSPSLCGLDWLSSITFECIATKLCRNRIHQLAQVDKSNVMREELNHIMDSMRSSDIEYIHVITNDNPPCTKSTYCAPKISDLSLSDLSFNEETSKRSQRTRKAATKQAKRTQASSMSSTGIIDRNIRQWTQEEYENNAKEVKDLKQMTALLSSKLFERERASESSDLNGYALNLSEFKATAAAQSKVLKEKEKIIEELKKDKEMLFGTVNRQKMKIYEMDEELLEKQHIIDQMNDHCAELEEERDLFASNLEEIIMEKCELNGHVCSDEKTKTEAIPNMSSKFLLALVNNGTLVQFWNGIYCFICHWIVMTTLFYLEYLTLSSDMKRLSENELVDINQSMIQLNECKRKNKEKKTAMQKQRKHFPTLCAPRHAFKLVHFWLFVLLCACAHGISTNIVLSGSNASDMNERGYYDENLIMIENEYRENIFGILETVKPSPPRTTTKNIFYNKRTATAPLRKENKNKFNYLEQQHPQQYYGHDPHQ